MSKIDYRRIRQLIDLAEEKDLAEFALEIPEFKLHVVRNVSARNPLPNTGYASDAMATGGEDELLLPGSTQGEIERSRPYGRNIVTVSAPIVGTFFSSPSPDTAPYVQEGMAIDKGQVLCIIEAMKLMNEIESEYTGTIVSILVENESSVEYGAPLFLVEID